MMSMRSFQDGLFQKLFVLWILVLPFVVYGNIYEGAKVFVFWIGSFVLILYWLIFWRDKIIKVINKWDLWYFIWTFILIISSFNGIDPVKSLIGGGYRHQGVIFFISLWLVGKTFSLLSSNLKEIFKKYFLIGILIEAGLIIFHKIFDVSLVNNRPIGTLGDANAVAGFLNFGLFFSQNIYFVILIFISNLVLQSRSGVLIFLILCLPFLFKRKFLLVLSLIVSLLFIFNFTNIRNKSEHFRFEDRKLFTQMGISAFTKNPLLGYGLESGDLVFEREFKAIDINLEDLMIDRSHNFILDILLWSGVLGLVPFLVWIGGNLVEIYKVKDYLKFAAIISLLTFGLLQPIWLVHWILLFLILNW